MKFERFNYTPTQYKFVYKKIFRTELGLTKEINKDLLNEIFRKFVVIDYIYLIELGSTIEAHIVESPSKPTEIFFKLTLDNKVITHILTTSLQSTNSDTKTKITQLIIIKNKFPNDKETIISLIKKTTNDLNITNAINNKFKNTKELFKFNKGFL